MLEAEADLRKEKRIDLQIPVRISREPDIGSFFISSMTQLSEHGAFVSTSASFQTGAIVKLEFDLPQALSQQSQAYADSPKARKIAKRIQPVGRITWQGSGEFIPGTPRECQMGIGIRFIEISDAERRNIGSFIHEFFHQTQPCV